jgi:hypothetical protein
MSPASTRADPARLASERVHTERAFEFVAEGPMSLVAPLFGAHKERLWAPGWDPRFIWPAAPEDRTGMVFTVSGRHGKAVWINTRFDLQLGCVQYAYVIENSMSTLITLNLTPRGEHTHVAVVYERTALNATSDALVEQMAAQDAKAGPEWAAHINAYLSGLGERTNH